MPLLQIYNSCVTDIQESRSYKELTPKEKAMYKDILGTIRKCMKSADKFIELAQHQEVDAKSVFEMLSRATPSSKFKMSERIDFSTFVTEVLLTKNGKPNLQALEKYGVKYNPPDAGLPLSQSSIPSMSPD